MASRKKTRLAAAICAAGFALSLGTSAAVAGEITGNGKSLKQADGTLHGRSECAFSGQNDEFHELGPEHPRVQSWGQLPKEVRVFLTSIGVNPGIACNPTRASHQEP